MPAPTAAAPNQDTPTALEDFVKSKVEDRRAFLGANWSPVFYKRFVKAIAKKRIDPTNLKAVATFWTSCWEIQETHHRHTKEHKVQKKQVPKSMGEARIV